MKKEEKERKTKKKIQYRLLNFSQANRIDTYEYTNLELPCDYISFLNVPQCEKTEKKEGKKNSVINRKVFLFNIFFCVWFVIILYTDN
jgi:hypothetical protein